MKGNICARATEKARHFVFSMSACKHSLKPDSWTSAEMSPLSSEDFPLKSTNEVLYSSRIQKLFADTSLYRLPTLNERLCAILLWYARTHKNCFDIYITYMNRLRFSDGELSRRETCVVFRDGVPPPRRQPRRG